MTMFTPDGRELADQAIAEVEEHADDRWMEIAVNVVETLAKLRVRFTTDEVWEVLESLGYKTIEPRAMGAVMRQAVWCDYIESTGTYRPSKRPQAHARPILIWRSKLAAEPF